jgi:hypothetical protein
MPEGPEPSRPTVDPAVAELLSQAEAEGISTAFSRATGTGSMLRRRRSMSGLGPSVGTPVSRQLSRCGGPR